MSSKDTGEERNIMPTPQRLRRLRREGTVPRSKDFQTAMSLLAVVAYVFLAWRSIETKVRILFEIVDVSLPMGFAFEYSKVLTGLSQLGAQVIIPIVAIAISGGILGAAVDAQGFPIQTKSLVPNFERLSPASGLKNLFSVKSLTELLKGLSAISLVIGANVLLYRAFINDIVWAPSCGVACVTKVFIYVVGSSIAIGLLVVLIMAVIDLRIARWLFKRDNRMTASELKREQREEMGDPQIRKERRRVAVQGLKTAEFIGMHRAQVLLSFGDAAVAITYRHGKTEAPVIAARTRTEGAAFVLRAAEMHIPIVEEPELVVTILERAMVGDYVPDTAFNEIARVLVQSGALKM